MSTWIVVSLYIFFYLIGLAPLVFYSNNLLTKMNEDGDFPLTPTKGTAILSIGYLGCLLTPLISKFLGSRPILYGGHFFGGACMIAIGILQSFEIDIGAFIFMFIFIVGVTSTVAPKVLIYTSEVGGGMALAIGIGNFVKDIILILLSQFTQPMFESALNPEGVFFLFGGLSILGGIHHFFLIKESDGLTYEQKKYLYRPLDL